jgi:hypothetical protein
VAEGAFAIPKHMVAVVRQTLGSRLEKNSVGDWLAEKFPLLGFTFQNWMVVILAMIVVAMLIARIEEG